MPPTIKDVAKKAGVGVGTVSRVFNRSPLVSQKTQDKVLAAAHELGYYPDASARRLVRGTTRTIAFIERHAASHPFVDAFSAEVLRGIHGVISQAGYHVLIEPSIPGDVGDRRIIQLIREKHADGIIISGPRFDDPIFNILSEEYIPVVLQGQLPDRGLPCVDADNLEGSLTATQHLINLGHQQIGMISNGPYAYTAAQTRRQGYQQAMQAAGLTWQAEWIQTGAFTPESGYIAMQKLLAEEITAVFVASDTVALGAYQAIKEAGKQIPEDLAVIGFDDIPWAAYFSPPLTTVRLPARDIGRQAAHLLITLLEKHPAQTSDVLLPTRLILRSSTGPKPDNGRSAN
jgi:LacI family transcriptional regulator